MSAPPPLPPLTNTGNNSNSSSNSNRSSSSPQEPIPENVNATAIDNRKSTSYPYQNHHLSTRLSHAGIPAATVATTTTDCEPTHVNEVTQYAQYAQYAPNAVPLSPPLHMATTVAHRPDSNSFSTDSHHPVLYGRDNNPTRLLLEQEMGRIECHCHFPPNQTQPISPHHNIPMIHSFAFASGQMAVSSLILAHQTPLHILLHKDLYQGIPTVITDVLSRFVGGNAVTLEQIDMRNLPHVQAALDRIAAAAHKNTQHLIVWMETPSNPRLHVLDLPAMGQMIEQLRNHHNPVVTITAIVDSTLAPPVLAQPLWIAGMDAVLHSATKYLAGHSDATLGMVTLSPWTRRGQVLAPILRHVQTKMGGMAAPFECWLVLRGLRTLSVRVAQQSASARHVVQFLLQHHVPQQRVKRVYYPGVLLFETFDSSSPPLGSVSADRAGAGVVGLGNGGGVLSFELETAERARKVVASVRLLYNATSFGGTESTIEHRARLPEPDPRIGSASDIPPGLLRVSIGLEHVDDIIADLHQALTIACNDHTK